MIYTLNVLEHIKNDQEAAEQARVAAAAQAARWSCTCRRSEMLFTAIDVKKLEHYRRYRRTQLNRILRNAGLDIVESRYCDPIGLFATLAYKIAGRSDGTINPRALKLYDRAVFPASKAMEAATGKLFDKNILVVATKSG